jgi:CRISPR-associated autoregulator DevR family
MKLHSLSISGIVTMNMHALNNEGSEGNTMMTRMVEIVDAAGNNHTVNAVSGDMFKHIQAEHLFMEAQSNNLPLCSGCRIFDSNRCGIASEIRSFGLAGEVDLEQMNDEDKAKYEELNNKKDETDDAKELKKIEAEMYKLTEKYWVDSFSNDDKISWEKLSKEIKESEVKQKNMDKKTDEYKKNQSNLKDLKKQLQEVEKKYRTTDSDLLDKIIKSCTIDDLEGVLFTVGKRSLPRKSVIEFGWLVGCPENTRTESYFHAKYVPEGRGKGSGSGENLGQNIFHRPASSGQYAVVLNVDLYRVGRNDIILSYVDGVDRQARIKALLRSVLSTFIKPTGAHRNTQHPHILDFSGVVATSLSSLPAPVVSGLNPDYRAQIKGIADSLNITADNKPVSISEFNGLADFSDKMATIINAVQPFGG